MLIRNARGWTAAGETVLSVRLDRGAVTACGELAPLPGEQVLDLAGDWLLPGFVDVHIHGSGGFDAMRGEADVRGMSRVLRRLGVAAFCPTTMSASPEETRRALAGIEAVRRRPEPGGARVLGAHMEAPFLSPEKAGAQDSAWFCDPDRDAFEGLRGETLVKLITLAPERPGSEAFIRWAAAQGIHVSLGHSAADAETVHRAADWGADHATHLFNAASPLLHRAPGLPGAALTDGRVFCELICDGVHLHRDIVRLAVKAKAPERALAITDAMEAAGLPDGTYALGGAPVEVRAGKAQRPDGTLAGSVLTMPRALHWLIHEAGVDPRTACAMCTSVPAASVGEPCCGRLFPGSPLPLTRWTSGWEMAGVLDEDALPL